jgi:hypothetical protein
MQSMSIEESKRSKKSGCFVSKCVGFTLTSVILVLVTAAILITYYAKSSGCNDVGKECQSLLCKNQSLIQSNVNKLILRHDLIFHLF